MTIQLVKKDDCRSPRRLNKLKNTDTEKCGKIELFEEKDCSLNAKLKKEKMTSKEKGWYMKLIKADDVIEDNRIL